MVKFYLCIAVAGILFLTCSEKAKSPVSPIVEETDSLEQATDTLILLEEEILPESVDQLFDDFFFNFTSDRKMQNARIAFPLKLHNGNEVITLSRDDWERYNRFSTQEYYSVIYEREQEMELQKDTSVNAVSVEWIYLKDDYIERFNFKRIKGKWMLTDIDNEVMTKTPNGNFLSFYAQFAGDSVDFHNIINQPLKFITPSEDTEEEMTEEYISFSEWIELKEELPIPKDILVNIDYGQSSISQNRKVLLMEELSSGIYIKFKFDKKGGQWRLIEIEN
ncbi:MAG: DUF4348 domain-containing protein [Bacteroides sp.]|nr:DUF4348 domain-containing protein [Roseburia sp.]MCM1346795.1 DUF4348 domain-containing protein [Bacteroides sp.]MCM1420274.1 DUF4348 domain-containing protein [Bacteroides sp.]